MSSSRKPRTKAQILKDKIEVNPENAVRGLRVQERTGELRIGTVRFGGSKSAHVVFDPPRKKRASDVNYDDELRSMEAIAMPYETIKRYFRT